MRSSDLGPSQPEARRQWIRGDHWWQDPIGGRHPELLQAAALPPARRPARAAGKQPGRISSGIAGRQSS